MIFNGHSVPERRFSELWPLIRIVYPRSPSHYAAFHLEHWGNLSAHYVKQYIKTGSKKIYYFECYYGDAVFFLGQIQAVCGVSPFKVKENPKQLIFPSILVHPSVSEIKTERNSRLDSSPLLPFGAFPPSFPETEKERKRTTLKINTRMLIIH